MPTRALLIMVLLLLGQGGDPARAGAGTVTGEGEGWGAGAPAEARAATRDGEPSRAVTSIELREEASAPVGEPVRLGDVAVVRGPLADELSRLIILDAGEAGVRRQAGAGGDAGGHGAGSVVELAEVRAALRRAGVNWSRVTLCGGACRLMTPGTGERRSAAQKIDDEPRGVDLSGPATVRTLIAQRLAMLYAVAPEDLRLRFGSAGSTPGETGAFLDTRAGEGDGSDGRRVEVSIPASGPASGRITVNVGVFSGERVLASRSVAVDVLIRRRGVAALRTLDRDELLTSEALTEDERWLAPGAELPVSMSVALASSARRRVEAGRLVTREDVQPPVVVERGDLVWVDCRSGGVSVRARARAMGRARDGERVNLKLEGSARVFSARMQGRGRAVMVMDRDIAEEDVP